MGRTLREEKNCHSQSKLHNKILSGTVEIEILKKRVRNSDTGIVKVYKSYAAQFL